MSLPNLDFLTALARSKKMKDTSNWGLSFQWLNWVCNGQIYLASFEDFHVYYQKTPFRWKYTIFSLFFSHIAIIYAAVVQNWFTEYRKRPLGYIRFILISNNELTVNVENWPRLLRNPWCPLLRALKYVSRGPVSPCFHDENVTPLAHVQLGKISLCRQEKVTW